MLFEKKIHTVSVTVNGESFAVVPFDTYEDAIKAAKRALVALNTGEDTEALRKRLNEVEAALVKEITKNTMVLNFDGERFSEIAKEQYLEHHLKELNEGVCDPIGARVACKVVQPDLNALEAIFAAIPRNPSPLEAMGKRIEAVEKAVEMLREGVDRPHKRKEPESHERCQPLAPDIWITWGYQDDGLPMVTTMDVDVVNEWIREGKKVFELQKKPINY